METAGFWSIISGEDKRWRPNGSQGSGRRCLTILMLCLLCVWGDGMQKQEEKKMEKSQDGRERGTDARQKTNLNCCLSCDENITFFSFFLFSFFYLVHRKDCPQGHGNRDGGSGTWSHRKKVWKEERKQLEATKRHTRFKGCLFSTMGRACKFDVYRTSMPDFTGLRETEEWARNR